MTKQNQRQLGNTLWSIAELPRRDPAERVGHDARAELGHETEFRRHRRQPAFQLPLRAHRRAGGRRAIQEPRPGAQIGRQLRHAAARLPLPEGRRGDGHLPALRGLFRGGAEERIRTRPLKDGHINNIICLPANLVYSTGIPVCILVLKKCKKPGNALYINAGEHIAKIIKIDQYREDSARYSRRVEMAEIEKNDFHLNSSRYISTAVGEAEIDLDETHQKLVEIEKAIAAAKDKHNAFLRELDLKPLPWSLTLNRPRRPRPQPVQANAPPTGAFCLVRRGR